MSTQNIQDQLNQFDLHDLMVVNEQFEIQDMGDYVVIDDIFLDPDAVLEGLIKFPSDSADEVKRLMYQQEETPKFKTPNGITQLLPNQYFDKWFQEVYKLLIEAEYVPHQVNTYLENPQYMSSLSRSGLVTSNLLHDNMVMHKRANWPSPLLDFEYGCQVFLGDVEPENGISFYDLLYDNQRYHSIDDLKELQNKEQVESIKDYLNVFVTVQSELEQYEPYQQTKYYDKRRFIEAKKNRMVIYKSGQWMTDDYNNKGERYTFATSISVFKDQEKGEMGEQPAQNQMRGEGQMMPQMPQGDQPQQWDSDY